MKLPMEIISTKTYVDWADELYVSKKQDQSSTEKESYIVEKENHRHLLPTVQSRASYHCFLGRFIYFKDRFHGISMGVSFGL